MPWVGLKFVIVICPDYTHYFSEGVSRVRGISQRTSDSLNEGLPMKMTREKFQRK